MSGTKASVFSTILQVMNSLAIRAVADNVRRLLEARRLSQKELAALSGVSQKSINDLLNYGGTVSKEPRLGTIEKLAKGFGIATWQLQIPGLPVDLLQGQMVSKVIENFRDAGTVGRENISRVAESEVRYSLVQNSERGDSR
nr:helix-turn-helix transcriptional regulator [Xylella fastidiosa]